ncbi:dioxygenase [Marinovum sp. B10]|uniref:dioxygenase n=1 Tax=Marinovum sp. B10 TaxID=3449224 RepID=UPI003EDCA0B1
MRNVTQENITDAFISYMGEETDPRLREVMTSLVRHLHAFAKEVNLTHAEWQTGIAFLERAGEISDAERHEFVLLSDVLGLSSLVDMLHSTAEGTSSSVLGPFHISGSPPLPVGGDLRGRDRGAGAAGRRRGERPRGQSDPRRPARHLADRAERALFQPGPGTGYL